MITKLLGTAIAASMLVAAAAPIAAYAAATAAAPKTKAECIKHKDMKWDTAKHVCLKK
ncbi:MAG TPA: hypothetical protein VKA94_12050 [Hyphomicrobiales bacterium]|nr:hypothetical protein [Hyphomicrobiales bacterium]